MQSLHRRPWAGLALALFALVASFTCVRAAEPGALAIIVDGSGSMWGPIDGRQMKLAVARDAVRRGLGKLSPSTRVGLAMFGHRRGDCSDVEVRPPEPLDVDGLMAPLDRISPRGRGPITLAVREAARSLARETGPRSLLLIHDDADNCAPDLCAAAAELRAENITAHVVGLAVKPEDMAKMACLPQVTGGRHFNAQNAEQASGYVEEAMLMSASPMAAAGMQRPGAPPGTTAIVAPTPMPASGPTALHLRALAAPNTEPLNAPLYWTVAAEARPDAIVFGGRATNPTVPVAPGKYVVEARDGPVSSKQTVEVRDNRPAIVTMLLNAGMVRIRVPARKSAELLPDAVVTITDANGGLELASTGGEITTRLAAGRHTVRAELGLVRAEQTMTITAGRLHAVDVPLNAARLQLTTAVRDGKEGLDAPVFSILEDDPDSASGRRELARSAAQPAEFVLQPGTYYVLVRQGVVEARERLAIGPGEVIRRTLTVATGSLALSTKLPPFGGAADAPITYVVTRMDGGPQDVLTTSQPSPTLTLPSGRYRVEARYGLMNVRTVRETEVKAGQAQQLMFEQEAAALRLRLVGSGPTDVSWIIRDQTGKAVWTGAHSEAVANLQAGRYVVRAETRNKRNERSVDLRAGEAKLLEFSVD